MLAALAMTWKHSRRISPFRFAENTRQSCADALALRLLRSCACGMIAGTAIAKSNNQAAIQSQAIKGGLFDEAYFVGHFCRRVGSQRECRAGPGQAAPEDRRHPRHVEPLCRHHRPRQRDRGEDGGGGFRRRGARPQDPGARGRPSEQGRPLRQHRPRHARQSGRRDDLRRRGLRDRACRRRDRESAQQDHHVQRPGLDPSHQRGLRSLHRPLRVRHLRPGQCDRPCGREVGPRHLVLPHRRLRLRPGSGEGHQRRRHQDRRQGARQRPPSAQHVGLLVVPAAGAGLEGQGDRARQRRRRHRQRHQAGGRVRHHQGRPEGLAAARLRHRHRLRSGSRPRRACCWPKPSTGISTTTPARSRSASWSA